MNIKLCTILLCLVANITLADNLTAPCTKESGITKCTATESSQTVMNLSCNHANGKSSCKGQYFDDKANDVGLECSVDTESFRVKCSGGGGKDKFSINCGPAELEFGKLACLATDASGDSLQVMCDMTSPNGLAPECSGVDSDGVKHSIACTVDEAGKTSCSLR